MKLFSELVQSLDGPVIVVGGGPSAPEDLLELKLAGVHPVAVLSANEHGHKQHVYQITHSVCCDARHGEKRISMELLLGQYEKPIITPAHFGHFRLPEWSLACNTGLTAICVGVFMGGHPVIGVGMDFYRMSGPGVYFHDANAISNSTKKNRQNFDQQINALEQWVGARSPVRVTRGLLLERFPAWDPAELVAQAPITPRAKYIHGLPRLIVQCRPYPPLSFKLANVEPGRLWPCSPNECRGLIASNAVKLIETHPAPGQELVNLPPDFIRKPRGYRPSKPVRTKSPLER